jgi:hypothetical protein
LKLRVGEERLHEDEQEESQCQSDHGPLFGLMVAFNDAVASSLCAHPQ